MAYLRYPYADPDEGVKRDELVERVAQFQGAAGEEGKGLLRAWVAIRIGDLNLLLNEFVEADRWYRIGQEIALEEGDGETRVLALKRLGSLCFELEDLERALEKFVEAFGGEIGGLGSGFLGMFEAVLGREKVREILGGRGN